MFKLKARIFQEKRGGGEEKFNTYAYTKLVQRFKKATKRILFPYLLYSI